MVQIDIQGNLRNTQTNVKNFEDKLGSKFIHDYSSSPIRLLSSVYPEYNWISSKFSDIQNKRVFMDWLANELKIKHFHDWYHVTNSVKRFTFSSNSQTLRKLGSRNLLNLTTDSLPSTLQLVYPEHNWLPWQFNTCPPSFWSNTHNQKQFLEWAGKQLKINELSDWYKITNKVNKT